VLLGDEAASGRLRELRVTVASDLLKACSIRIESLDAPRTVDEWKPILAGTDYAILVLRATQLLSEQERQFVRDVLATAFGLERVVVVVNMIDRVCPEERAQVVEYARAFFGTFEREAPLIELSATPDALADPGLAALIDLVRHDLLGDPFARREATLRRLAQAAIDGLAEAASRQEALLTLGRSDLEVLMEQTSSRGRWAAGRIARFQDRIDLALRTLLKEQFFREIEGFGAALREQMPAEVASFKDLVPLRRHLAGYLEALWESFLADRVPTLRTRLIGELKMIADRCRDDLREMLGGHGFDLDTFAEGTDLAPTETHAPIGFKRGEAAGSTCANGLGLGGLLMMSMNLPLGLTMVGAGQITRIVLRVGTLDADREALLAGAITSSRNVENEVKRQAETRFEEAAARLKDAFAEAFGRSLDQLHLAIERATTRRNEADAHSRRVDRVRRETIPELTALLSVCPTRVETGRMNQSCELNPIPAISPVSSGP
jgi:hypothetical protein